MDNEKIGSFIKKLRERENLTQEQLGQKLRVSRKAVSKWECGKTLPDITLFPELAECLKIDVDSLIKGEEESTNDNGVNFLKISKLYIKQIKYKSLICISIVIILAMIICGTIFFFNNFNKNRIYSIYSLDTDYSINGYLIYNQLQNLFILNNIAYQGDLMGTSSEPMVKKIEIFVSNGDKIFYSQTFENDREYSLSEALSDISFSIDERKTEKANKINYKTDLSDIYLEIYTYDEDSNSYEVQIPLKFDKEFSNNRLSY